MGKALKGPMCTYEFSGGVAMDHSPTVGLVATTVAHEVLRSKLRSARKCTFNCRICICIFRWVITLEWSMITTPYAIVQMTSVSWLHHLGLLCRSLFEMI